MILKFWRCTVEGRAAENHFRSSSFLFSMEKGCIAASGMWRARAPYSIVIKYGEHPSKVLSLVLESQVETQGTRESFSIPPSFSDLGVLLHSTFFLSVQSAIWHAITSCCWVSLTVFTAHQATEESFPRDVHGLIAFVFRFYQRKHMKGYVINGCWVYKT